MDSKKTIITVLHQIILPCGSLYHWEKEKYFNRYVRKFPTRMFLDMLGYEPQNYTYLDYNATVDAPQSLFGE